MTLFVNRKIRLSILLIFSLIIINGCGTFGCFSGDSPCRDYSKMPVYCGVRCDITAVKELSDLGKDYSGLGGLKLFPIIDVPFSLVVDTIILPYTVIKALFYLSR